MATIKGTWLFNEVITPPTQEIKQKIIYSFPEQPISDFAEGYNITFRTNGSMSFSYKNLEGGLVGNNSIYYNAVWASSKYRTISFGSTDQEVSDEFYAQFTANATSLDEPEATAAVITYNGATLATLEAGQTATIKTAETEVEHDIVITPAFPIEIAYGDIIATAEAGQTATIKCANTEADFDIVVSAKAEEANKLAGIWLLNEVIIPPAQEIKQAIIYTTPEQPNSNFSEGTKIGFLDDGRVYFYYRSLSSSSVSSPVYVNDAWQKQGWRTIDFGATPQEVSPEFYAQFTANATKQ